MRASDDLPLDDYDHLPVGSLTSRIRSLDAADLQTLLAYEKAPRQPVPGGDGHEEPLAALKKADHGRRPARPGGRRRRDEVASGG